MANLILELRVIHADKCAEYELKSGRKLEHTPWSRAADEIEKLERCLRGRDDFLVGKGLWHEFTDSLRRPPAPTAGQE